MEFNKLINLRESCRNFDPQKEVGDEQIENIINSAQYCENSCKYASALFLKFSCLITKFIVFKLFDLKRIRI